MSLGPFLCEKFNKKKISHIKEKLKVYASAMYSRKLYRREVLKLIFKAQVLRKKNTAAESSDRKLCAQKSSRYYEENYDPFFGFPITFLHNYSLLKKSPFENDPVRSTKRSEATLFLFLFFFNSPRDFYLSQDVPLT